MSTLPDLGLQAGDAGTVYSLLNSSEWEWHTGLATLHFREMGAFRRQKTTNHPCFVKVGHSGCCVAQEMSVLQLAMGGRKQGGGIFERHH